MEPLHPRSLEEGRTWQFQLPSDADIGPLLGRLADVGAAIADVESSMASLQDIFLKLTRADEPPASRPAAEATR
jgi:hypothetical protein